MEADTVAIKNDIKNKNESDTPLFEKNQFYLGESPVGVNCPAVEK
jgi:hypothetical protein